MCDMINKLLPKLLSFDHKCNQTKCKQMSEEFENMKKFILYSNQLNIQYLNLINGSEELAIDDKELYRTERETLLQKIKSELKSIGEAFRQIITGNNWIGFKQNSSKFKCDLCQKSVSTKLMSSHLGQHLDTIFDTKLDNNYNNNEINETIIENQLISGEKTDDFSELSFENFVVKDEHSFDGYSEEDNNWSHIMDGIKNAFSEEESLNSEELMKRPKRKSKRINQKKSSETKPNKSMDSTENLEPGVNCEECGKEFKCQKFLSIHLGIVHKKYKTVPNECHLCDFKSINNKKFRNHMIDEHSIDPEMEAKSLECSWPGCNLIFFYNVSLQRHFSVHTDELPFGCEWPGCQQTYKTEKQLREHIRLHTGEKPFQCHWPGCERSFRHKGTLRSHVLTHDKSQVLKHICHYPECGRSYEVRKLLRQHIYSVHEKDNKPFRCSYEGCGASFVATQNLNKHIETIHAEHRVKYRCQHEACQRTFFDIKQMEAHMQRPHGVRTKRTQNNEKPKKKYIRHLRLTQCDWPGCDYIAKLAYKIKEHKARAHTWEKPLKCDYPGCDFRAVRKFDLKVHTLKHTGETPFPCEYPHCGRRFKSQRALDTHSTKNHSLV